MDNAHLSTVVASAAPAGLYPRLLGAAWSELREPVRRIHRGTHVIRARGTFDVRRGSGWIARCLCALLRLPTDGSAQPVLLLVTPHAKGERWDRTIGNQALITTQTETAGNRLLERFGPVELGFHLAAVDGALAFQQTGAALRLGALRVPLPRLVAPQVTARASAQESGRGIRVQVRLSVPFADPLVAYEGPIEEIEHP